MNGYELLREYEKSLLEYWEDGHGHSAVLIAEFQGFLTCLVRQCLIAESQYMYLVDCFIAKLSNIRKLDPTI